MRERDTFTARTGSTKIRWTRTPWRVEAAEIRWEDRNSIRAGIAGRFEASYGLRIVQYTTVAATESIGCLFTSMFHAIGLRSSVVDISSKPYTLFGSVLREDFRPDSDIDMLVEFEDGHAPGLLSIARMERELSEVIGVRKVDLRRPEDLSRYFRQEVLAKAEVQYAQG